MLRLLYISTARPQVDQQVLDDILHSARVNNRSAALTGLLVFDGKRFMQYLEGEEDAVRSVYAKIVADPRHFAVVKLRESHGDERQFADWDMAILAGIAPEEFDRQVDRVADFVENCDVLTAAEIRGFVNKNAS